MERREPAIEMVEVEKRFGALQAVAGLSLTVPAGVVYGLLGPNGAGKSTTIQLLAGLLAADRGTIRVCGEALPEDLEAARATTAYVSESVSLYPQLSGIENLTLFSRLGGQKLSASEAGACLERAGLPGTAHGRRAGSYSKGMRQKVGLAIALAKEARVLLLDEPSSGLDPAASFELAQRIREVADGGAAVLMATHDLFRAQESCDTVGLLAGGRLVRQWAGDEVGATDLEAVYLETVRALETSVS